MNDRERLTALLSRCYDDPDLFNTAILGRKPLWQGQREIARSVCDYRITVAYTGNSVGKDYLVGTLPPWWLYTRHRSLVVVTGPGQNTLGSVTWKEIRRATEYDANNPLSSVPLGMRVSQRPRASPLIASVKGDWQALGYSTNSVERASGQHNRKLFVIVEEASGVEDEVYDALDSLKYVRLLLIGNPLRATGRMVDLIHQAEKDRRDGVPRRLGVNAIRIPSTDSPHAGLEESPFGLADRTWLDDCKRRYGETSLWYRCHVKAEIPSVDAECLIPLDWLDWSAAQPPRVRPYGHPVHRTRRIACDLGEGVGRDSGVVLVRDDWGVIEIVCGDGIGLSKAAHIVGEKSRQHDVPPARISYDKLGIGREFPHHLQAEGLTDCVPYAGEASPRSRDFANLRTEAAFNLRRRLDPNWAPDPTCPAEAQPGFHIPPGPHWEQLRTELKPLTYHLAGRQTQLLRKKDWTTILGHSPDVADALIQSFAFV